MPSVTDCLREGGGGISQSWNGFSLEAREEEQQEEDDDDEEEEGMMEEVRDAVDG